MAMIMPWGGLITASKFLIPYMPMLLRLAAELGQRVEVDVDRQIDVRDLLLRFGQAARDRLAHVGELDDLVRNFGFERARRDDVRGRRRWGGSASGFAEIGADNPPAGAA